MRSSLHPRNMTRQPRIHAGVLSTVDLIELKSLEHCLKGFHALSMLLGKKNLFSGVYSNILINILYLISID